MEPLSRPGPPRSIAESVRAWVTWFGVGRLVATSVATVVVAAGAFWLVRTPPPTTEASLPRATTTASTVGEGAAEVPAVSEPVDVFVHVAGAVVEPVQRVVTPGDPFALTSPRRIVTLRGPRS